MTVNGKLVLLRVQLYTAAQTLRREHLAELRALLQEVLTITEDPDLPEPPR